MIENLLSKKEIFQKKAPQPQKTNVTNQVSNSSICQSLFFSDNTLINVSY